MYCIHGNMVHADDCPAQSFPWVYLVQVHHICTHKIFCIYSIYLNRQLLSYMWLGVAFCCSLIGQVYERWVCLAVCPYVFQCIQMLSSMLGTSVCLSACPYVSWYVHTFVVTFIEYVSTSIRILC